VLPRVHERQHDHELEDTTARVVTEEAKLVLAYRHGEHVPPPGPIRSRDLLPPELAHELDDGMLVLQPLAVLDRPLGYLLFEQTTGSARVTALMRTEISRAIDAVLTTEEVQAHAEMLERVVDRRTRELQAEVVTRQRTERELQRAVGVLHRSAMLDGLTQIANRTAFIEHIDRQWSWHARDRRGLALLMVDVDAFKLYNDHYGHLPGDEAPRTVAECLEQAVADPQDLACRYGGEEFIAVLACSGVEGALAVSERFQQLLAAAGIPHAVSPVSPLLTTSIGIAVGIPTPDTDPEVLLEAADQALYQAKAQGRDRVVVSDARVGGEAPPSSSSSVPVPAPAGPRPHRPTVTSRRPRPSGLTDSESIPR
jgi:diguanylate cyclase (GGDEF)-like protein